LLGLDHAVDESDHQIGECGIWLPWSPCDERIHATAITRFTRRGSVMPPSAHRYWRDGADLPGETHPLYLPRRTRLFAFASASFAARDPT
jgi:hypothetical protein